MNRCCVTPRHLASKFRHRGATSCFSRSVCFRVLLIPPVRTPPGRAECRLRSQQDSRPSRCLLRASSSQLRCRKNAPLSHALFPSRPRRQRTSLLDSGGWNLVQDLWEKADRRIPDRRARRRQPAFTSTRATATSATKIFCSREFLPFIESHYRVARRPPQPRHHRNLHGRLWRAPSRASLIRELFGSVSAHSAALIDKLPAVQSR